MYKIQCDTMQQFVTVCFEMMKLGATYKANAATLLIELTGGF